MMTKEAWESLLGSPGWEAFKLYMLDYRHTLMETFAAGACAKPELVSAQCQILARMAGISLEQIQGFYQPDEQTQELPQDEA